MGPVTQMSRWPRYAAALAVQKLTWRSSALGAGGHLRDAVFLLGYPICKERRDGGHEREMTRQSQDALDGNSTRKEEKTDRRAPVRAHVVAVEAVYTYRVLKSVQSATCLVS